MVLKSQQLVHNDALSISLLSASLRASNNENRRAVWSRNTPSGPYDLSGRTFPRFGLFPPAEPILGFVRRLNCEANNGRESVLPFPPAQIIGFSVRSFTRFLM